MAPPEKLKNYPGRGKFSRERFKLREEKINAAKEEARKLRWAKKRGLVQESEDDKEKKWRKPKCSRWLFPGNHYPGRPAPPRKGAKLSPEEIEAKEKDLLDRLRRGESLDDISSEKAVNSRGNQGPVIGKLGMSGRGRYFQSGTHALSSAEDKPLVSSEALRSDVQLKDSRESRVPGGTQPVEEVDDGEGEAICQPLKVFFDFGKETDKTEEAVGPNNQRPEVHLRRAERKQKMNGGKEKREDSSERGERTGKSQGAVSADPVGVHTDHSNGLNMPHDEEEKGGEPMAEEGTGGKEDESSSDDEEEDEEERKRAAAMQAVAAEATAFLTSAQDVATASKRKARRGHASTARSREKAKQRRSGGGGWEEDGEEEGDGDGDGGEESEEEYGKDTGLKLHHYQLRAQDLLHQHLARVLQEEEGGEGRQAGDGAQGGDAAPAPGPASGRAGGGVGPIAGAAVGGGVTGIALFAGGPLVAMRADVGGNGANDGGKEAKTRKVTKKVGRKQGAGGTKEGKVAEPGTQCNDGTAVDSTGTNCASGAMRKKGGSVNGSGLLGTTEGCADGRALLEGEGRKIAKKGKKEKGLTVKKTKKSSKKPDQV